MPNSDKMKGHAQEAAAEYEAHLGQAEDRLEAAAQKTDRSFREHTAGAKAHLEQAEDRLEAAAKKTDGSR